jgi:MinD-like ATPase involved in chromosome partitioning or flagellar assembly
MWISFHSYKGGTGKTNIAGNLACYLAKTGRRVGLVDTDVSGPGMHSLFSLKTGKTLVDYLLDRAKLPDIVYEYGKAELYIIPSDATEEDLVSYANDPAQAREKLTELFRDFESKYNIDHIIFDCSPGLNRSSLLIMGMTGFSIVVCTLDKQDIRGTYVFSGVAQRMKARPHILFNKLPGDKYEASRETLEELSRKFGLLPIGVIMYDEAMAGVWSRKIMVHAYPDSEYSEQIKELWERIDQYISSL